MTTRSSDQTDHLRVLGAHAPGLPEGAPGAHLLETFPNLYPGRPYIVSIAFPEFTSLCPVTGQPDFASIVAEFIPDQRCVESKSFKRYMFAYRSHQAFMESITNAVLDGLTEVLDPLWCRIKGLFAPRGGTQLHVFAEYFKTLEEERAADIRRIVNEWKQETRPHGP